MKKILVFLSIVALFYTMGFAQTKSVSVDNVSFTHKFRHLPDTPLYPMYFNYAVRININGVQKGSVSEDELAERSFISGQVKVTDPAHAEVIMELTTGNIIVTESEVKERKVENKNKKTGEVTTTYYYWVSVKYTFESSYLVRKRNESLLRGNPYTTQRSQSYTSKEYKDRKSAADFWSNNREALIAQFSRELSLKSASTLSETASRRFGFPPDDSREVIKTISEKKHNENEAFRAASATLREALSAMTADFPVDKEKMRSLIDYYKSVPERYTTGHKADVRLRYAALFNICKIYLFMEEPEKVGSYADMLTENGYDTKDAVKLIQAADELQALFNKTGIRTRHFNPARYFSGE